LKAENPFHASKLGEKGFLLSRTNCVRFFLDFLAESEGFEPPVPQAVQQISSLPRSTTLPTLQWRANVLIFFIFVEILKKSTDVF